MQCGILKIIETEIETKIEPKIETKIEEGVVVLLQSLFK